MVQPSSGTSSHLLKTNDSRGGPGPGTSSVNFFNSSNPFTISPNTTFYWFKEFCCESVISNQESILPSDDIMDKMPDFEWFSLKFSTDSVYP